MMHMWFWWDYNLGEFMFSGLNISTKWSFALTWIALFIFAFLFEASKVYLAKIQRKAQRRFYRHRSDERRNLLCERDHGAPMDQGTSHGNPGQVNQIALFKTKMLMNTQQTSVFIAHNTAGYLLMLAVMLYNVYLMLAVVLGMMLGYFVFGPKLTRLQMQCFNTKNTVICTPECDDTAETSTPPLLDGSIASESDFFICHTRTCAQPSHYFRASEASTSTASCSYGAKKCPSKVARAKHLQEQAERNSGEKQPLNEESTKCCKKKSDLDSEKCCGKKSSQVEMSVQVKTKCCQKNVESTDLEKGESVKIEGSLDRDAVSFAREESPRVTCCSTSSVSPTDSREQIIK